MPAICRNFLPAARLHVDRAARPVCGDRSRLLALRSLPSIVADAIPRRFSSSSLPPSFVSGRFAGFSFSISRALGLAGV